LIIAGTKMKLFYSTLILISITVVLSCSKLVEPPPPPAPELTIHKTGILDKNSHDFHGKLVRENNWSMSQCIRCHGADYQGGTTDVSCFKCHTQPAGPEACNTCHGNFDDPNMIAPPQDVSGNTSTDSLGVGAHYQHLYENDLSSNVECSTCHKVPQNYSDPGHLDSSLPAEVMFSGLATTNIASNASYDYSTGTCSNTYCHGNFEFFKDSSDINLRFMYTADKMAGNNKSVVFNKVDGTQDECGSCHGLPPEGHLESALSNCGNVGCHEGVVDAQGNIIDTEKHINGMKNVRGN
jgi:hypothetical protein